MKMKNKGFTLIELVVIIVVLGILSAIASAKYVDMQRDARAGLMEGIAGAINGAKDLVYTKSLLAGVEGALNGEITIGGATLGTVTTAFGFPDQQSIDERVNLPPDIIIEEEGTTVTRFEHGKAQDPDNCVVIYTEASDANTPAVINLVTTGC